MNLDLLINTSCAAAAYQTGQNRRVRIEDRQKLLPLAECWLDEAKSYVTGTTHHPTSSAATSEESDENNRATNASPLARSNVPSFESKHSIIAIDGIFPTPLITSTPLHLIREALKSSVQSFDSQARYNLRPGNSNVSAEPALSLASI